MWHSHCIVSLKIPKSILEHFCISPFEERRQSQCIYYFSFFLLYGIVFFGTFYLSVIYTRDLHIHANDYDTFYFVKQMKRFAMGPCFCFGIILSLCSRAAQLKLQKQLMALDVKLKSHLRIEPSFSRLNFEFCICCVLVAIYNYGNHIYYTHRKFDLNHAVEQIYYSCSILSEIYFYCYGFFTIYWARMYINRSEYIIDALKTMTSQKCISKRSLSLILELINLLFEVRESIQNAFGTILFLVILVMTLESAESSFGVLHSYERKPHRTYMWLDYLFWFLVLWSELTFIFMFFEKIGEVVSGFVSLGKLIQKTTEWIEMDLFLAQVEKMQAIMSRRYFKYDENIEACVSVIWINFHNLQLKHGYS